MIEIALHYQACQKLKKALKYSEMSIQTLDSLQELKTLESERESGKNFPIFKSKDIKLLAKAYATKIRILQDLGEENKAKSFAHGQIRFLDKLCISKQDENYNFIRGMADKILLDSENIQELATNFKSAKKLNLRPKSSAIGSNKKLRSSSLSLLKFLRPNSAIKENRIKNMLDSQEYSKSSVKLTPKHGESLNADAISQMNTIYPKPSLIKFNKFNWNYEHSYTGKNKSISYNLNQSNEYAYKRRAPRWDKGDYTELLNHQSKAKSRNLKLQVSALTQEPIHELDNDNSLAIQNISTHNSKILKSVRTSSVKLKSSIHPSNRKSKKKLSKIVIKDKPVPESQKKKILNDIMTKRQFLIKKRQDMKKLEKTFERFNKNVQSKKFIKLKIKRHLIHHKELAELTIMKRNLNNLKKEKAVLKEQKEEESLQELKISKEIDRKKELLEKVKKEAELSVNNDVPDLLGIKNVKTTLGNILLANFTNQLSIMSQVPESQNNTNQSHIIVSKTVSDISDNKPEKMEFIINPPSPQRSKTMEMTDTQVTNKVIQRGMTTETFLASEINTVDKQLQEVKKLKKGRSLKLKFDQTPDNVQKVHPLYTPSLKPVKGLRGRRKSTLLTPQNPLLKFFPNGQIIPEEVKRKEEAKVLAIQEKKFGFMNFIQMEQKKDTGNNSSLRESNTMNTLSINSPQKIGNYSRSYTNTTLQMVNDSSSESEQCEVQKSVMQQEEDLELKSEETISAHHLEDNEIDSNERAITRLASIGSTSYTRDRSALRRTLSSRTTLSKEFTENPSLVQRSNTITDICGQIREEIALKNQNIKLSGKLLIVVNYFSNFFRIETES